MNDQPDIYQVAEAYVIAAAMNNYIKTFTTGYSGSRDATEYQAAMQFFISVFKKYRRIAQTPVEYDACGNLAVKNIGLRSRFDVN
jgi:hypothetical protein